MVLEADEEFAEYFLGNITLDNDGENRKTRREIVEDFLDEIREARKRTPPSRYMEGEDFTYTFKKLY